MPKKFYSLNDRKYVSIPTTELNQNARASANEDDSESEILSELVPDVAFSKLLNGELEIQVENTMFKITEFGTFFTSIENIDSMLALIGSFNKEDLDKLRNARNTNSELNQNTYEDAYILPNNISYGHIL